MLPEVCFRAGWQDEHNFASSMPPRGFPKQLCALGSCSVSSAAVAAAQPLQVTSLNAAAIMTQSLPALLCM